MEKKRVITIMTHPRNQTTIFSMVEDCKVKGNGGDASKLSRGKRI